MKKQFFRVKQLADQTFLRADKSDEINNELQNAEKKIEYLKSALVAIYKKLPTEVQGQNENVDKRKKKYTEYQLGTVLMEQGRRHVDGQDNDDICKLFNDVIIECGMAEFALANEMAEHENKMESIVSKSFHEIIENDLPNISKLRKTLNKYTLDKDSARNRLQSATNKHGGSQTIRAEMEEAEAKVEQSKDLLAIEMFTVLKRENELSQYVLQMLKLQRAYHESALEVLKRIIPGLESKIGRSSIKPVFGVRLEEHLNVTNRKLALPLEVCICALTELGMSEEGLFRMAGTITKVRRLKLSMDSGCFTCPLLHEYRDVHVIASTLKMYLRELPEPILTSTLYNDWIECMRYPSEQRLEVIQKILKKLPEANRDNLTYLMQFLAKLPQHPENKMTPSNIAIVIAPNLLWQGTEMDQNMSNCSTLNMIVEFFINNVNELFPNDVSKYVTVHPSDLLDGRGDGDIEHEFRRPHIESLKSNIAEADNYSVTASPKPQIRKMKKAAPVPPAKCDDEYVAYNRQQSPSYPSGSTTLSRCHKVKVPESPLTRSTPSVPEDDVSLNSKRNSLTDDSCSFSSKDDYNHVSLHMDIPKTAEVKYVISQPVANIQLTTARPVQQVTAQITNMEQPMVANNLQSVKPVAAPRTFIQDGDKNQSQMFIAQESSGNRNSSDEDADCEVQFRKSSHDDSSDKAKKPLIPERPASLKVAIRPSNLVDNNIVQKTQVSMYNVAHKQQPNIVNITNRERFQAGHDTQITEKEKFLGHQPTERVPTPRTSLENKFNDVNFNYDVSSNRRPSVGGLCGKPQVPSKQPHVKSNELLNSYPVEKFNGNPKSSHVRTRSDGNIVDASGEGFVRTPPSPRHLSKPTEPPPPPPVSGKVKADSDSTDL